MTTATLEKRVRALEEEIVELRKAVKPARLFPAKTIKIKKQKLSAGLRQALREVEQGKLSGPFSTADEFMAHLTKR